MLAIVYLELALAEMVEIEEQAEAVLAILVALFVNPIMLLETFYPALMQRRPCIFNRRSHLSVQANLAFSYHELNARRHTVSNNATPISSSSLGSRDTILLSAHGADPIEDIRREYIPTLTKIRRLLSGLV